MSWKLTLIIGIGLCLYAGWLALREHAWLRSARVVPGTVAELIPVASGRGKMTYRPRIRYTTPDGTVHDFIRAIASNPVGVGLHENVAVAYHDSSPQDLRILTFGQRFGVPVFVGVAGICLVLLGGAFLQGRQWVPRIYLAGQRA